MSDRMIFIAEPVTGPEEYELLKGPLETGWLTQGPKVAEFERLFAERHGVQHAIATTSCTTAMHLALAAKGIGPGDHVAVPAFTWVSTANVVRHVGATPVFVDVDVDSYNIDPAKLADAMNESIRAVMPVHLFGLCADMQAIKDVVGASVVIVEDAACAVGAEHGGSHAGALGDAGCFSFHPRKIITTGEGGMVTTNDDAYARQMKEFRNHGATIPEEVRHHSSRPYHFPDFDEVGFNFRMTDLQGAVGVAQMGRLDALLEDREKWAAWYRERLKNLEWLVPQASPTNGRHGYQSFVCRVDEDLAPVTRDEILEGMHNAGVSCRPGTHAPPLLGCYGYEPRQFPVADRLARTTLALPLHGKMTEADYHRVADTLDAMVRKQ